MEYPSAGEAEGTGSGTFQLRAWDMVMELLTYDLDDAVEVFAKTTVYGTFDEDRIACTNRERNSQVQLYESLVLSVLL